MTKYDLMKEESKKSVKFYKERRRVVNIEMCETICNSEKFGLSVLLAILGTSSIGMGLMTTDSSLSSIFYTVSGCSILGSSILMHNNANEKKEKLNQLRKRREELNEIINNVKLSKEDKKTLKKEYVKSI